MADIEIRKQPTILLDPSDKFRPEKKEEEFRNYTTNSAFYDRVYRTYHLMHTYQDRDFALRKSREWTQFNHAEMTLMEALDSLRNMVDESDPDVNIPNSVHAFQTAERIRQIHPELDWFQLVGLIHDLGKVMANFGEPQWAVTGDTFPVGCAFSDKIVFERESFKDNCDYIHPVYSTPLGVYEKNCGLDKVAMAWGHDEYLYQVLSNHPDCKIPKEGLYMVRFHSFYAWHTGGDYMYLCNDEDLEMLKWIREFNKFDLYSKADEMHHEQDLIPYYQGLIDKYCPGTLKW